MDLADDVEVAGAGEVDGGVVSAGAVGVPVSAGAGSASMALRLVCKLDSFSSVPSSGLLIPYLHSYYDYYSMSM